MNANFRNNRPANWKPKKPFIPVDPDTDQPVPVEMPQSREMEEATLGSIMINPFCFLDVKQILKASDFFIHRHRWIFEAIDYLTEQQINIDLITIADQLDRQGQLEEIGGPAYLTSLVNQSQSSLHVLDYARVVEEMSIRRHMIYNDANQIASLAFDTSKPIEEVMTAYEKIRAGKRQLSESNAVPASLSAQRLIERIRSKEETGISTHMNADVDPEIKVERGLPKIDRAIGGWPRKHTSLIFGNSSVGKTAFMLQNSEITTLNAYRSLYITLESDTETITARRVFGNAERSQIALRRRDGLSDADREQLIEQALIYQQNYAEQLYLDDRSYTLEAIERSIYKVRPDFVVVDYLSKIRDRTSRDNQALNLLANAAALKELAKAYNCHINYIHILTKEEAQRLARRKSDDVPPSYEALGWASDLRYEADIIGCMVPKLGAEQRALTTGILPVYLWILKDREGEKFNRLGFHFHQRRQWFYEDDPNEQPDEPAHYYQAPEPELPAQAADQDEFDLFAN